MPFLLLVITCFARATSGDAIKPLFEANSIAEYNQWLSEHSGEFAGFREVRTQADFFADSETRLPRYVLDYYATIKDLVGLQTSPVQYLVDGDHCVVCFRQVPPATSTAYDIERGRLFETHGRVLPRFGMWFRDVEGSMAAWRFFRPELSAVPESTEVLDDQGRIVGVLPRVTMWRATSSGDTLIAAAASGGALVFDREARVRWQDSTFGNAPRLVVISPDAGKVAVVTRDSVCLHDMTTGTNKVLSIPAVTVMGYRTHLVVWSTDSRRFAIYRADSHGPSAAVLWVFTDDGKLVAKPRRLDANYGEQLFWMGDTVVLATTPYVDSLGERLHDKHWFVGPIRVTTVPLRGYMRTWIVKGQLREGSDWFQQGRRLASVSGGNAVVFQVPTE